LNLGWICCLKEQLDGFDEIGAGLLDRVALAGNIKLGTERHVPVVLSFDETV
jgi:hypothetical protein